MQQTAAIGAWSPTFVAAWIIRPCQIRLHVRSIVESSDVEDVVPLEERLVRLDPLRLELLELAAVLGEAARGVEVEDARGLVADVPEVVDDVRRSEDVRAGSPIDDLVPDVELDLALEDVERVAVPLVEVGETPPPGWTANSMQRELGAARP